MISLILLGYNIWARHELLAETIGTRSEENDAYYRSFHLLIGGTLAVLISSLLEMVFYFLYNCKVLTKYKYPHYWYPPSSPIDVFFSFIRAK